MCLFSTYFFFRCVTNFPDIVPSLTDCFFFLLHCRDSLCILDTDPLSYTWLANILSHLIGFLLIFLMVSLEAQKVLILLSPFLFIFDVAAAHDFGIICKNPLQKSKSWRFAPMFPLKSLIELALIFRYLIHFESIFLYSIRKWSNFIFSMWLSQDYMLNRLFFL